LSTARLHAIGSAHEARYGENFDETLADVIARSHNPAVAADQLDERTLLTILAQFAGAGRWDPYGPALADAAAQFPGDLAPDDYDPAIRRYRYVIFHQPGDVVDLITFEGYALRPDQTGVRTADVKTVRTT